MFAICIVNVFCALHSHDTHTRSACELSCVKDAFTCICVPYVSVKCVFMCVLSGHVLAYQCVCVCVYVCVSVLQYMHRWVVPWYGQSTNHYCDVRNKDTMLGMMYIDVSKNNMTESDLGKSRWPGWKGEAIYMSPHHGATRANQQL